MTNKNLFFSAFDATPGRIAALAGASLALGVVYWLLRDRDERQSREPAR